MVVNKMTELLMSLGLSEYESRAYASALALQSATAYEIARDSGIPTSKIYETIRRLKDKGLLFDAGDQSKKKYAPLPPKEFLAHEKSAFEKKFNLLGREIRHLAKNDEVSFIWNLHDYGQLIEKSRRLITEAKTAILLSVWNDELGSILDVLAGAEKRGVKIAVIHFGEPEHRVGMLFVHPIKDTLYAEKGGRGYTLVADSSCALMGTVFADGGVEGAWSANRGFVMLAEDYIKHDIYIMKIVARFDRALIDTFGTNYKMLRDIFNDKEHKA